MSEQKEVKRKDGYYWLMLDDGSGKVIIAKWVNIDSCWLVIGNSEPFTDSEFLAVGPYIDIPLTNIFTLL